MQCGLDLRISNRNECESHDVSFSGIFWSSVKKKDDDAILHIFSQSRNMKLCCSAS